MSTWTDERVAELRRLWGDGMSASQIAAALGAVSRNAVIGKAHRLGLSGRAKAPARTVAASAAANAPTSSRWDEMSERQKVAYLREAMDQGRAASIIAAELGATTWQVSSLRARARITPPQSNRGAGDVLPMDLAPTRTLMTVRHGECRAVIGEASADDTAMCGRPVHTDTPSGEPSSYCLHHHRRFHRAKLGPPPSVRPEMREGEPMRAAGGAA